MNIYLHVETSIRELESKILLAVLAASRGHEIIISDIESLEKGIKKGLLAPGIYHTKSLSPVSHKIARHKMILKNGNLITSIDEENGLITHGYEDTANMRYSKKTIKDASAIFCWGKEDVQTLKNIYSKYSSKIYCTGSPRADLWRSTFTDYWNKPHNAPKRPYLLVASNMSWSNYILPFYERILQEQDRGHYNRNPKLFLDNFSIASEQFKLSASFIEAMQYISREKLGFDIVFRPHPNESIKAWKTFLKGIPNLYVIKDGPITAWVKNSFAVMHNGCTTALEATISNKTLLTFIPFKQEFDNNLSNELGIKIKSKEELVEKLKIIFSKKKIQNIEIKNKKLPNQIEKKIYIDENELASDKIIKVWEKIANKNSDFTKKNNWIRYKLFLKKMKINGIVGRNLKFLLNGSPRKDKENFKFPPLNYHDISKNIEKFIKILKIKKNIKFELLSERTILIKQN